MAGYGAYPVELTGEYSERVNRFLWLIKWILIIPHWVVLSLLSLPVIITTPVAWLAIIITGRCPSFLRGYHAGLQRWFWRVNFYSYEAGNTDRYPPFSFAPSEDYPADLIIEYPERSSRLTALFRWILVIPHLIIIYYLNTIGQLLTLFVLLVVLFTGRYPRSMFDTIMGVNRWCYRVIAYAFFLVDEYPPFSFD